MLILSPLKHLFKSTTISFTEHPVLESSAITFCTYDGNY